MTRDAHLAVTVCTKFEVDTTIRCLDTLRDLVTLTFDLLTLVSGHTWQVMCSTPPPSLKILRLSILEIRVLTSPIGCHCWMRYNIAADSFYVMKFCSRLFVLHCRSRPKYDNCRHFDPHFGEFRGGVEPWWMARWKGRAEFLLSVIELLFLSLTVEALQGKTCQNSQPPGVGRSLWAKISGERGRPWGIFFWFLQN